MWLIDFLLEKCQRVKIVEKEIIVEKELNIENVIDFLNRTLVEKKKKPFRID